MKTIAFIFARGGSKRVPGKNIRLLEGKPLLAYSIELAKELDVVSDVFVSTDDTNIANIAKKFGAKVIIRPSELAQDNSPEWLSWRHAIDYLKKNNILFEKFLSLPTTSPLRNKNDVQSCLDLLNENNDIVVTITESHRSPYFNMVRIKENGFLELFASNENYPGKQYVPKSYDMTTVAYVTRPEFIISSNSIFEGRVKAVYIPEERSLDIDTEIDFILAKTLIKMKKV